MNDDGRLRCLFPALAGRDLPLEALDLEASVGNALKQKGIRTLPALLALGHRELLELFPNRRLRCYEDVLHHLVCLSEETEAASPGFSSETDIRASLEEGKTFNLFQAAGIWKSEEIHTRLIAELLNPQSPFHDQGALFLGRLLDRLGLPLPPEELLDTEVRTEVLTDTGRRVDLMISAPSLCLPFEVKIWAGDQDRQLQDYYAFARSLGKPETPWVGYLTPDGRAPSPQSLGSLRPHQVRRLSFQGDVLPWLADCLRTPDIPAGVREVMVQLRDNIRGQPGLGNRPGTPGFSPWRHGEDVLDRVYRALSQRYDLPWTECAAGYETFTLKKLAFTEGALELALRVRKEDGDRARLYLICGLTQGDGRPDYASAGDYIARHPEDFEALLEAAFRDRGRGLGLNGKPVRRTWNRLPENPRYEHLDTEACCREIEGIFAELLPEVRRGLER